MRAPAEHGTARRYQQHRREGEQACDACREANRLEKAQHRATRPDIEQRVQRKQAARDRALRELARRFPTEFEQLYEREVAELGLAS